MASSHAAIQENLRGIPTELSASSPTKQANWIALQEKTKHNKANARKLIAVEASEKKAQQAGEAGEAGVKAYLSDFTLISLPPPSPFFSASLYCPTSSSDWSASSTTFSVSPTASEISRSTQRKQEQCAYVLRCSAFFLRSISTYEQAVRLRKRRRKVSRRRDPEGLR